MKNLVAILLLVFVFFFLLYGVKTVKQKKKFANQISRMEHYKREQKIAEICFDGFNYSPNRRLIYRDSGEIFKLMEILNKATSHYEPNRVGEMKMCEMHIYYHDEIITLNLRKDNRNFTSILYRPEGLLLLAKETADFNFLFERD